MVVNEYPNEYIESTIVNVLKSVIFGKQIFKPESLKHTIIICIYRLKLVVSYSFAKTDFNFNKILCIPSSGLTTKLCNNKLRLLTKSVARMNNYVWNLSDHFI